MRPFTGRIHTSLVGSVLFISRLPLQHTLHAPTKTNLHLLSGLEVSVSKEREGESARQRCGRSGKGVNAVMEGIEERTRKIGEEDEIEEKNQEARTVELNLMIVFAESLLVEGLLGLKDAF